MSNHQWRMKVCRNGNDSDVRIRHDGRQTSDSEFGDRLSTSNDIKNSGGNNGLGAIRFIRQGKSRFKNNQLTSICVNDYMVDVLLSNNLNLPDIHMACRAFLWY
jgi:hypothetical protein